jgi:hypothetical protein
MDIASTVSRISSNLVGPIAGGNYAHRREEVNRKKKIKSSKIIKNTGLIIEHEFVNGRLPPEKRVQLKRKVMSLDDRSPPPVLPANGVEHRMGVFLGIIKTYI